MRLSLPSCSSLLAAIGLATSLSLTSLPALSAAHEHGQQPAATVDAAQMRRQATDHTQALMALQKQWVNAKGSEKSSLLGKLIAKAEERQTLLVQLAQSNPAEVLRVAIPEDKQLEMPPEVAALLEQHVEISGESEVFYEDYRDGSHKLRRFVNTPFGERFELSTPVSATEILNSTSVKVDGVLFSQSDTDSDGIVIAEGTVVMAECCTDGNGGSESPAAGTSTFGEQKTLVMLVNFEDKIEQPQTKDQVRDVIFGNVNDFYLENSDNRTWLAGDVAGWYTIPVSSTVCDPGALATAANQEATLAGIDLSAYQRKMYVFPENACGWGGLASVGGYNTSAFFNGGVSTFLVGHEFGHNLGLNHSGGLECYADIIEGTCYKSGYGNKLDIMGAPNAGHFNAFQKSRLGWIDQNLITITESGTYNIEAYSGSTSGNKALRVLQNTDPSTGEKAWYYVEFRQPIGFDSFIADPLNELDEINISNGVLINRGTLSDGKSSLLLDMTPGSTTDNAKDFNDAALEVGQSFYDQAAGVEITTNWVDNNQASVSINVDNSTCSQSPPSLSLSPQTGQWAVAGTTVEYSVSISSTDSSACSPVTFDFSSIPPSGWSSSFGDQSATLAPGETLNTRLSVTSPVTATNGFYEISVTVAGGSTTLSDQVTYVVDNPAESTNQAPEPADDNATTPYETPVTIKVLANDLDPDGDTLSVSSLSGANGDAVINADGSITYTPVSGFSGMDTFSYTVSDGESSASATVTVTVEEPTINKAPIAQPDYANTDKNASVTITVLANDSDPDGDELRVISVTQGAKGDVQINANGTLTYTPAKNFNSEDSFSYILSDGSHTATTTVTIVPSVSSGTGKGNGRNK
ncbi:Ig-like domain-containing protein [Marinobacterium rhizophilum]|uniref:Ig-like domain-containing protein n=1 Tax=Marinobacterium rhizophilum TaxID=420402 RepID=UPI00039FC1E9|nr:Ig-like domain-containing protein [Marinobacterium rhizophilum]